MREDYHHEARKSTLTGRTQFVRATGTFDRTLQHGKLLTQGEVLEHEVSCVSTAEGEQRQQTTQASHDNEDYHRNPRKSMPTGRMDFMRATPVHCFRFMSISLLQ